MRKVKVLTDSCADVDAHLLATYDMDYLAMSTVSADGVESPALLEWTPEEAHAFYDRIRNGERITTSQVSAAEFERGFSKYLAEGYDIVYVACSSGQSGSVNTGRVIAGKLLADYPDAYIACIDSLNSSIGEGMLAIEAAKLAREGQDARAIETRINSIRKNVREYVTVHTLEYLRRAGRVSGSSAFFGNLMGVKPILVADVNGAQAAYKKVKGRLNSFKECVAMLKENMREAEVQTVHVVHADAPAAEVEALVNLVKAEIPCADVYVTYIGPIVGASVGPDTVGVFGFGVPETFEAAKK